MQLLVPVIQDQGLGTNASQHPFAQIFSCQDAFNDPSTCYSAANLFDRQCVEIRFVSLRMSLIPVGPCEGPLIKAELLGCQS